MCAYDVYRDDTFENVTYIPLVFEDVTVNENGELNISYEKGQHAYGAGIESYPEDSKDAFKTVIVDFPKEQ